LLIAALAVAASLALAGVTIAFHNSVTYASYADNGPPWRVPSGAQTLGGCAQ